ncbi:hypothetical protein HNP29_005262 [Pseudomonas alcaligenes]|nr:hypothetical protein [Pseudomonas alcaligenes]
MKKTLLWIKAIWAWLKRANNLWRAVSVAAIAVVYTYLHADEVSVRITGLVLQVLGIATVAWGIKETRGLFGQPSLLKVGVMWFKSFPPFGGRVTSGSGHGVIGNIRGGGNSYSQVPMDPGSSVDERLAAIERNLNLIHQRISHVESNFEQEARVLSEDIKKERMIREQDIEKTHGKIEAVSTGGLYISATGALWLFIGVVMSTAPNELIKLMG